MYSLTDEQYRIEAEPIFRLIFSSDSPITPFSPNITDRKIIFPVDDIYPTRELLEVLVEAAVTVGDTGCYLDSCVRNTDRPNYAYIPLSELIEAYYGQGTTKSIGMQLNIDLVIEHILFSTQATWGLLSHEYYGFLGGSREFMHIVQKKLPDINIQVYNFLAFLKEEKEHTEQVKLPHLEFEWLHTLLNHVYGKTVAERMLQESGLP
jgi:hypothetical protein